MIEQLENKIKLYERALEFYKNTALKDMDGVRFTVMSNNIMVAINNDYPLLLKVLRTLAQELGEPLKKGIYVWSGNQFTFFWKSPIIDAWFSCGTDNIPLELMPTDSCAVEEVIVPESIEYKITCGGSDD